MHFQKNLRLTTFVGPLRSVVDYSSFPAWCVKPTVRFTKQMGSRSNSSVSPPKQHAEGTKISLPTTIQRVKNRLDTMTANE